jgi:hypothetical protein
MITQKTLVLALLLTGTVFTAIDSFAESKKEKIDQFILLSGLDSQLREIPDVILMQFEEEKDTFDVESQDKIRARLIEAFQTELLMMDAYNYISENYDETRINAAIKWLQDPFTAKINELEISSGLSDALPDREAYFENLENSPPTEKRLSLIVDFDEITDATYNTVSIITEMYMSIITAMNPFAPAGQKLDNENYEAVKNSIKMQLLPVYERVNVMMNLYTYRTIDDEELEEYIDFYTTDDGEWFVDVSYGVMENVLQQASERLRVHPSSN